MEQVISEVFRPDIKPINSRWLARSVFSTELVVALTVAEYSRSEKFVKLLIDGLGDADGTPYWSEADKVAERYQLLEQLNW